VSSGDQALLSRENGLLTLPPRTLFCFDSRRPFTIGVDLPLKICVVLKGSTNKCPVNTEVFGHLIDIALRLAQLTDNLAHQQSRTREIRFLSS